MFTMYWFGGYSVLLFLAAVCATLVLLVRAAALGLRGSRAGARRSLGLLLAFIALYAIALCLVAIAMPRRTVPVGERECFDDWCVGGLAATRGVPRTACAAPNAQPWLVTLRLSSRARRGVERARDAEALLEDREGHLHRPCVNGALREPIAAGRARDIAFVFALPNGASPAGVIVSHGAFPDALIIGADQSVLHPRTLLTLIVDSVTAPDEPVRAARERG